MIEPLTNNELIFLKYLENVYELPDYIVRETEAVMLNGFIANYLNRFVQIPIEIITCGCLEYVCERNSFDLDYDKLIDFVHFLFPKQLSHNMNRINRIKEKAFARFDGKDLKFNQLRCVPYYIESVQGLFDFEENSAQPAKKSKRQKYEVRK